MDFPVITQEDIDEAAIRIKQSIYAVTVCNKCNGENFLFRVGCCEIGNVSHFWKTHDERYLTENEVSILS